MTATNATKQITITCKEGTNQWIVDFDCEILRRDINRIQRSIMVQFARTQRRYRIERLKKRYDEQKEKEPGPEPGPEPETKVVSKTEETPITPNIEPLDTEPKTYGQVYHPAR